MLDDFLIKMETTSFFFLFCLCVEGLTAKWSMFLPEDVRGDFGNDVVLPCNFTSPFQNYTGPVTVIWRRNTAFSGSQILKCSSEKMQGDCSKTVTDDRYSLSGHLRENDLSLRIKATTLGDEGKYFCRVELENSNDSFEKREGTELIISVPRVLESMYVRTYESGQQFVTCDVTGRPPPVVTWTEPANISSTMISVKESVTTASYSVPVYVRNAKYTCQIHDERRPQQRSLFLHELPESGAARHPEVQAMWIGLPVFMAIVNLLSISFTVSIILVALCKNESKGGGSMKSDAVQSSTYQPPHELIQNDAIYVNE
ncbi:sialic acid-binding Ig-like lectin 15 [Salminus brasiliensis]|uniref:sialic acid-binding Ig-like lectin 15 n=1 Tax=Salminus brasiliensis TaxID=930266 RepID=UPI003B83223F